MEEKLNNILQNGCPAGKSYLPSPFPVYKLILRKGALKNIMIVKGWKTYTQVASSLGFTRQYISMLADAKISVSVEFMSRLALCLGNLRDNWHVHYELAPRGNFDDNHPVWNQEKYNGKVPYTDISPTADLRNKDYPVEKKEKNYLKK